MWKRGKVFVIIDKIFIKIGWILNVLLCEDEDFWLLYVMCVYVFYFVLDLLVFVSF